MESADEVTGDGAGRPKRMCVIGAGPSGLTSIKCCLEASFEVVCYEQSDRFGGVWAFKEDDREGGGSVMRSTIINSSKEMSAFSDFPPPDHFANFMHNAHMLQYMALYTRRFHLEEHVRYRRRVTSVRQAADYEHTGRWEVTTEDAGGGGEEETQTFDGVLVCAGHHAFPHRPPLPGLDRFRGQVVHTHALKSAAGFEGRRVLVVGIGNSGVDAAVELSHVTDELYLSSRRGSWIFSRLGPRGVPFDAFAQRRLFNLFVGWNGVFPVVDRVLEFVLGLRFDHARYGLKPAHGPLGAHITMNDALPNCILSGRVAVKQEVSRFTERGALFAGEEDREVALDAVVLATGYRIRFPFLPDDVLQVDDNKVELYKLVFPPRLPHPTLALIGLIQPLGAIFPIAEAQARWFAALQERPDALPPRPAMESEIRERAERNARQYVGSPRHTIQVNWISYMDEICAEFGAKPDLWRLALTDPALWWASVWGPCAPYAYRLQGPHAWSGARAALLDTWRRIQAPLDTCRRSSVHVNPTDQEEKLQAEN